MAVDLIVQVSLFDFLDVEGRPIGSFAFISVLGVGRFLLRLGLQLIVEQYLILIVVIPDSH